LALSVPNEGYSRNVLWH